MNIISERQMTIIPTTVPSELLKRPKAVFIFVFKLTLTPSLKYRGSPCLSNWSFDADWMRVEVGVFATPLIVFTV